MPLEKPATVFVTWDVAQLDTLRNRFRGCGVLFLLGRRSFQDVVNVTLPRGSVADQSSLLDAIYHQVDQDSHDAHFEDQFADFNGD